MAKLKGGRLVREVSDSCLQYWGGMGFTSDVQVSRFYRWDWPERKNSMWRVRRPWIWWIRMFEIINQQPLGNWIGLFKYISTLCECIYAINLKHISFIFIPLCTVYIILSQKDNQAKFVLNLSSPQGFPVDVDWWRGWWGHARNHQQVHGHSTQEVMSSITDVTFMIMCSTFKMNRVLKTNHLSAVTLICESLEADCLFSFCFTSNVSGQN